MQTAEGPALCSATLTMARPLAACTARSSSLASAGAVALAIAAALGAVGDVELVGRGAGGQHARRGARGLGQRHLRGSRGAGIGSGVARVGGGLLVDVVACWLLVAAHRGGRARRPAATAERHQRSKQHSRERDLHGSGSNARGARVRRRII